MMGKILETKQFEIVHKTNPIEPDPYPEVAFPGWSCDWTKDGIKQGAKVNIG